MPFSPQRTLKAALLYRDQSYLELPIPARHLITGLLHYVDQQGRENANAATLREMFFEFDEEIDSSEVESLLLVLAERGWLLLYSSGKRQLMQVSDAPWRAFVGPITVSGQTPVRFWANTGWGEGGGRRRGSVDGGPRPSTSRGLPSTSKRSAYRELWALRLCSEAERRVHPGGDLSRGVDCRAPRTKGPPGSCR
jgi:hypothetical protein